VQETVDSATSSDSSLDIPASPVQLPHIPPVSIAAIAAPVVADMQQMNANLRSIASDRDPALQAAADQIFGAGGKQLRPMIVFLVARATAALAGLRCGLQHQAPACARIACLDPAISSCPCVRSALTIDHCYSNLCLCVFLNPRCAAINRVLLAVRTNALYFVRSCIFAHTAVFASTQ